MHGTPLSIATYSSRMSRRLIRKSLILLCAVSIAVYMGLSAAGGVLLMENALHAPRFPLTERATVNVSTVRVIAGPMVEIAFLEARLSHGLGFDKTSPEQALADSHVPSLLIAGLADQNIPPRHAREIVTVARSPVKLWEVPGAGHTAAMSVDPVEFQRRVVGWFAAHSHTIVRAA